MPSPLLDYRERLLERLETVVPDLADAIAAIPAARWHKPREMGRHSPHALLAHLRDVERGAYAARLKQLLEEDSPVFAQWDSPHWETTLYKPEEAVTHILTEYATLREEELQILRPLSPKEWSRIGRHELLGRRTVQWWAERILENAEGRLRELAALR
jgi:uncharacterized damage-inducible protein DinB